MGGKPVQCTASLRLKALPTLIGCVGVKGERGRRRERIETRRRRRGRGRVVRGRGERRMGGGERAPRPPGLEVQRGLRGGHALQREVRGAAPLG